MNPPLVVLGYSEAAMFLRRRPAPPLAVISIHGGREFAVDADCPRRLDLTFDDVDEPQPGDAMGLLKTQARRRWAAQNGLVETPPTQSDAAAIVTFAEGLRGANGTILCHCAGGMSRAPAAALICLATWAEPGAEAACVEAVRRLRQGAVPHAGLVRYADHLLGRGGALVSALGAAMS